MTAATTSPLSDVSRKVLQLQVITLIWMSAEAVVSLGTAWTSHSPALLAFGGDTLIEVLALGGVFWGFGVTLGGVGTSSNVIDLLVGYGQVRGVQSCFDSL